MKFVDLIKIIIIRESYLNPSKRIVYKVKGLTGKLKYVYQIIISLIGFTVQLVKDVGKSTNPTFTLLSICFPHCFSHHLHSNFYQNQLITQIIFVVKQEQQLF